MSASRRPITTAQDDSEASSHPAESLMMLWRGVRKNWVLIAGVALTVTLGVTFFTLGQKKIYRASTTIQIDPSPPRPLGDAVPNVVEMGTGAYLRNKEYYETQYSIIKSMRVATAVVRQLGLNRDAAFLANLPAGKRAPPTEVSVETAANAVRARLTVAPEKHSRLTKVSIDDANPARAQQIATTLVDTYREQNIDNVHTSTIAAGNWLNDQVGKLKKELAQNELALHEYKMSKNILSVSIDDQSNMLREEMQQLNKALTSVRTRREEIAARYHVLSEVTTDDPSNLPARELLESAVLNRLRAAFVEAVLRRDGLIAEGKGSHHPHVKAAQAHVEVTRSALLAEVKNIQRALHRELRATERQQSGLTRLYEQAKARALDLNLLEIEYNRLQRAKKNTERLYSVVVERSKDSDLTRMMRVNNIHVVDEALLPKSPVKPSVPVNLGIGAVAGLLLGLGVALGRDLLDRSVKSPDELERDLGLSFLGLLPETGASGTATNGYYGKRSQGRRSRRESGPTAQPELIVHQHQSSGVAEAARAIRTNILFMSPDSPYRTLLVTSAAPVEGKTTVACCIAIAMAQADQRVILVDCDMRRPRLHRIFGRGTGAGITNALLDRSELDRAVIRTEVPNLSVLPCGPIPPNPAELLQSASFRTLLEELRESFDRVIIDSPPLVPVTDGTVISTRVDGTIVVVRALRTAKDLVRQAVRSLRDVGGPVVGAVLNAVDTTRRDYGQYYQYYYYKREGYGGEAGLDKPDSQASSQRPTP